MSALLRPDRDIVPRWRGYRETVLLGEVDPPAGDSVRPWVARSSGTTRIAEEWQAQGTLSFAADLVGAAIVLGSCPDSLSAADQIVQSSVAGTLAKEAAQCLIDRCDPERARESFAPEPLPPDGEIRRLRGDVKKNMRNALRWSELARFHTIAGNAGKAERAMRVARGLAPRDRYVLRCAVRLEVHRGRPDRAAMLLTGNGAVRDDPWLLAAGLAAAGAAKEASPLTRPAQRLLSSNSHSNFETSELASALATLEVRSGNDRLARRLFRQSLLDPTDNAIAQAEWASRHVAGIEVSADMLEQPGSWEARAWSAAHVGEREKAVREAWQWHFDQPFATGPAELGSYQAAMAADFDSGAKLAEATLRANRTKFALRNSLAFCLAGLDRPTDASRQLAGVRVSTLSRPDRASLLVTKALVAFRMGRPDEGRDLVIESMETGNDLQGRALALSVLAREEIGLSMPDIGEMERAAKVIGDQFRSGDLQAWLGRLRMVGGEGSLAGLKYPNDSRDR